MKQWPFTRPGRFYKGNLHTHSTRSDGGLSPADVVTAYRQRGYDFVTVTDHFLPQYDFPITDTRPFRTDGFTTLLGAELHGPALANGEIWHILAVGLPLDFPAPVEGETGPAIAARAAATGAFIGLAHPAWYGLTPEDALSVTAADAIEVYNETCLHLNDRPDSWYISDLLAARGQRLTTFAADDAHFVGRPDAFAAWVWVKAEALEPAALLAALKAGAYYASTGPAIHQAVIDQDQLEVSCSPAQSVVLSGPGARARSCRGDGITQCRLPLGPFAGGFCRLTIVDAAGRRAWSNPIWLD
jgi:hypothetical protein